MQNQEQDQKWQNWIAKPTHLTPAGTSIHQVCPTQPGPDCKACHWVGRCEQVGGRLAPEEENMTEARKQVQKAWKTVEEAMMAEWEELVMAEVMAEKRVEVTEEVAVEAARKLAKEVLVGWGVNR